MTTSVSLYELETHLAALFDSEPSDAEQHAEYRAELTHALRTTAAKRDRVAAFLSHLDSQIKLAKEEEARLKNRRDRMGRAKESLQGYVLDIMRETGQKSLEGNTATFKAAKCPPSVEITDESAIPSSFNRVTVTMRARLWQQLRAGVPEARLLVDVFSEVEGVSKSEIAPALKQGEKIPGARLITDKLRLVVE